MPLLSCLQNVKEVPYPAPPWTMRGQLWMGLFKTDVPLQLPKGLKHLLAPRSLLVVLVRYLEGTLRYDELAFGVPARLGTRVGIYVDSIWVTDLASLWGGRRIWGVPKDLAKFAWEGSTVRVTDERGLIAAISMNVSPAHLPWMWMPTPGIGQLEDGAWAFTVGRLWARLGRAGIRIEEWPTRFTYRPNDKPTFSFAAKPFRLHIPAAKALSH